MASKELAMIISAQDRASAALKGIEANLSAMTVKLRSYAQMATGALGLAGVEETLRRSLGVFADSELAINKLAASMQMFGTYTPDATRQLNDYARSLSEQTTVGKTAIVNAMQLGVAIAGFSGDKLQQATKSAIGLSAAYGVDLDAAMKSIAKAANGNVTALQKLGVEVDKNASSGDRWNQIINQTAPAFGVATSQTHTLAGAYQQAQNIVKSFIGTIGQALAPAVKIALDVFVQNRDVMRSWLNQAIDFSVAAYAMIETTVKNITTVLQLIAVSVQLTARTVWEEFKYAFDVVLQLAGYFGDTLVAAVKNPMPNLIQPFLSLGQFVKEIFGEVFTYVTSWGQSGFADGFVETITTKFDQMLNDIDKKASATAIPFPEIAGRQISDSEKQLADQLGQLTGQLGISYADAVAQKLGQFKDYKLAVAAGNPDAGAGTRTPKEDDSTAKAVEQKLSPMVAEFLHWAPGSKSNEIPRDQLAEARRHTSLLQALLDRFHAQGLLPSNQQVELIVKTLGV